MDKAETYRPRVYRGAQSADNKTAKAESKAAKPKSKAAAFSMFDLSSPAAAAPAGSAKESKTAQTRADGRTATQLRPIFMKTGVISQAAGSAYIEINNTKVICGVYGPRQNVKGSFSDKGKLFCDFKFAPFALNQRRKRGQDPDERAHSLMLVEALEVSVQLDKFPKSVLEAFVIVLEDDGGLLGATITCVSLAIADAGVEMYDLVAACSVGASNASSSSGSAGSSGSSSASGGPCLLDPTREELAADGGSAHALLAFMPSLQQVTHVALNGTVEEATAQQMIELCTDGCSKIYGMMRDCLVAASEKKLKAREKERARLLALGLLPAAGAGASAGAGAGAASAKKEAKSAGSAKKAAAGAGSAGAAAGAAAGDDDAEDDDDGDS